MEGGEHLNQMLQADGGSASRGGKHVHAAWAGPALGSVLEQVAESGVEGVGPPVCESCKNKSCLMATLQKTAGVGAQQKEKSGSAS